MMRLLAIGIVVALMAMPAFADDYKIGVMHVERIMRQSKPAREAQARIEQEFKARDADITRKEQEVQAAAAQFAKDRVTLSRATRQTASARWTCVRATCSGCASSSPKICARVSSRSSTS